MKKLYFTWIMIVLITLFIMSLIIFDLSEVSTKFMLIPMLIVYFLGQYSERKFI